MTWAHLKQQFSVDRPNDGEAQDRVKPALQHLEAPIATVNAIRKLINAAINIDSFPMLCLDRPFVIIREELKLNKKPLANE